MACVYLNCISLNIKYESVLKIVKGQMHLKKGGKDYSTRDAKLYKDVLHMFVYYLRHVLFELETLFMGIDI